MVAFFGVIIAVNIAHGRARQYELDRAWWWTTPMSPARSSTRRRREGREQAALGWTGVLGVADGKVSYRLDDRSGDPVRLDGVTVQFRHPAYDREDETVELEATSATAAMRPSTRRMTASGSSRSTPQAGLARPYRDVRRIYVQNGEIVR